MLSKKNKQLKKENEILKQNKKSRKMGIFALGTSVGALLAVAGNMLLKTKPIEKVKYQAYKVKEKFAKIADRTVDNIEEISDEIESKLNENITDDESK